MVPRIDPDVVPFPLSVTVRFSVLVTLRIRIPSVSSMTALTTVGSILPPDSFIWIRCPGDQSRFRFLQVRRRTQTPPWRVFRGNSGRLARWRRLVVAARSTPGHCRRRSLTGRTRRTPAGYVGSSFCLAFWRLRACARRAGRAIVIRASQRFHLVSRPLIGLRCR